MNTLTPQELQQQNFATLAAALETGPVHIIEQGQSRYVLLSEQRYRDLLDAEDEAYITRVQAALADVEAGRVRRFDSTAELMAAIDEADDE